MTGAWTAHAGWGQARMVAATALILGFWQNIFLPKVLGPNSRVWLQRSKTWLTVLEDRLQNGQILWYEERGWTWSFSFDFEIGAFSVSETLNASTLGLGLFSSMALGTWKTRVASPDLFYSQKPRFCQQSRWNIWAEMSSAHFLTYKVKTLASAITELNPNYSLTRNCWITQSRDTTRQKIFHIDMACTRQLMLLRPPACEVELMLTQ
jgi:hypothetical protein